MNTLWILEQGLFIVLFSGLLTTLLLFIVRANRSVKRTNLILPPKIRIALLVEVVFIALCILTILAIRP